jgi:uncharacterized membrane-anchored protein
LRSFVVAVVSWVAKEGERMFLCRYASRSWLLILVAWSGLALAAGVPPRVEPPSPRLVPVCVVVFDSSCGLLDRDGHWAVEPRYGALFANGDVWVTQTHAGRSGLLDANGKELVAPGFDLIGDFDDGIALATTWTDQRYGYIDTRGNWLLPQRFHWAGDFADGMAPAQETDQAPVRYIDRQGKPVLSGNYPEAGAFRFGLAEVSRGEGTQHEAALIDRKGQLVIRWAHRYGLQPIGPDRVLETAADGPTLRDGKGHVLFHASGGGAASEDRLFYTLDDETFGLLDLQTGKPLVAPRKDWLGGTDFADGVAWMRVPSPEGQDLRVLLDRQGRVVLPAANYAYIGDFADGAAAIRYPDKDWQLIDKQGHALTPPRYNGSAWPAWNASEQTPRPGDVWYFTQDEPDRRQSLAWVDSHGRLLASVESLDCGIEVVRNGHGETIWPKDVAASCAVKRPETGKTDPADAAVPAERIAAVRRAKAQDVVDDIGDVAQRDAGHGIAPLLGTPLPADPWMDGAWQAGPRTVHLDGPASLAIPAGFRYLPASAVLAMRDRLLAAGMLDADAPPGGLLAPVDRAWTMLVVSMLQGHVDTGKVTLDADSLSQTMETYGSNILGQLDHPHPTMHSVDWVRAPRWDAAAHRLDWTYSDMTMGGMIGNDIYMNAILLGRRWTVAMQIHFADAYAGDRALIAQDAFDKLTNGVSFDTGETYADTQPGDRQAALGLTGYITGPEPKEMKEFPENMAKAERSEFWRTVGTRVLPMLGLAMVFLASRRKKKP